METYSILKEEAKRKISLADHIIFVTYPIVRDPKLLVAVMENLFLALTSTMAFLLYYEKGRKRVPPFFDTFESKFRLFSEICAKEYPIDDAHIRLMLELKEIMIAHKRSPIEFSRRDQFIICSDDYELKVLNYEEIKDYVAKVKTFNTSVEGILAALERQDGILA